MRASSHLPPAGSLPGQSLNGMLSCIQLSEECQLDGLYTNCVLSLAKRLCYPGELDGFAEASQLAALDRGTLLLTLGTVLQAVKKAVATFRCAVRCMAKGTAWLCCRLLASVNRAHASTKEVASLPSGSHARCARSAHPQQPAPDGALHALRGGCGGGAAL